MPRQFSLSGLLRLRGMQQDQAASELAAKNAAKNSAHERRLESERWLLGSDIPDRSNELTFHAAVATRVAAVSLLQDARIGVAVAEAAAQEATVAYQEARARTKALEKLRDRHDVEVAAQDLAEEQLALDEVASRRAAGPRT